jgi:hypothetical protein
MAGKNRLLAKILGNNNGLITPDSDLLAVASTKNIPTVAGTSVYSSIDDLPSSASAGEKALVTSINTLYLYNSGWYKIALINNFNPQWVTQPSATYDLAINSTPTVITMLATDSDDVPIRYIATTDSGFNSIATVSHDSDKHNVFTIIPIDSENGAATGGTGTITFKATDGVNQVQQVSTFSLSFFTPANWSSSRTQTDQTSTYGVFAGRGVDIDYDGTRMIAGWARNNQNEQNYFAIKKRTGSTWAIEKEFKNTNTGTELGAYCTINHDGDHAFVGIPRDNTDASGGIEHWTRSGTTWTKNTTIRAQSTGVANSWFGWYFSINETADKLISVEGVYQTIKIQYYTRSGSTWTRIAEVAKPASNNTSWGYRNFGGQQPFAMSGDGNWAVIGASGSDRVYVYKFNTSNNAFEYHHVYQGNGSDELGMSVDINYDGTYIAAASRGPSNTKGTVYVYYRSGAAWDGTANIATITPSDLSSNDPDGADAVYGYNGLTMGARFMRFNKTADNLVFHVAYNKGDGGTARGMCIPFDRSSTNTWTQRAVLQAAQNANYWYFGYGGAVSGDGQWLAINGYGNESTQVFNV